MRGQFTRGDGLILPNNISLAGSQMILEAALKNNAVPLYAALVVGVPTLNMTIDDMTEPTDNVSGYQRILIPRDGVGWPNFGQLGNEFFAQSQWLTWIPTGPFDKPIQRIALVQNPTHIVGGGVFALSSPLPQAVILDATTPLAQRQFKYQLFL